MRSLEQIIRDDMTEAEREEYDSIDLQRRVAQAKYIETLEELDRKRRAIRDKHKKRLNLA